MAYCRVQYNTIEYNTIEYIIVQYTGIYSRITKIEQQRQLVILELTSTRRRCIVQYTIILYSRVQYIKVRYSDRRTKIDARMALGWIIKLNVCVCISFLGDINFKSPPPSDKGQSFFQVLSYLNLPPLSHRAKLAKIFKKSKMPTPPRPKAELREGKALPTPPKARGRRALGMWGGLCPP